MIKDLKTKKEEDLVKMLASKRDELQKVRFNFSHGGNKNTMKESNLKKDISKILNEIRERELNK
jgi:ribosomal protein L29